MKMVFLQIQLRGREMNKAEQVIMGFRDLLNKLEWLNKFKMEASLEGYKPSNKRGSPVFTATAPPLELRKAAG
jgi:hypothetical protein